MYVVENMLTKKLRLAHVHCIHIYRADMDGTEMSKVLMKAVEQSETQYLEVARFKDIRPVPNTS